MRSREILPLTGLRGLAATLVFLFHAYGTRSDAPRFTHFPTFLAQIGWAGVPIFFTLSGFLLTALYYDTFKTNVRGTKLKTYLVKRFARIYPVYFVCLAAIFSYALIKYFRSGTAIDMTDWSIHLFLLQGYFGKFATSVIPAAWTLTIEETFYFLLPFFCWIVGRIRGFAIFIPIVFWILGEKFALTPLADFRFFEGWPNYTLFGQLTIFFIGAALGILMRRKVVNAEAISTRLSLAGWFVGIAVYIFMAWFWRERVSWMEGLAGQLTLGPCAVALIVGCMGQSLPSKILSSPAAVYVGHISYAFYLCHGFVIQKCEAMSANIPVPVMYGLSLLIAAILHEIVEKPARRFLTAHLTDKTSSVMA